MGDWAGFWVGLGFAVGCFFLAFSLNEIAESMVRCVRFWIDPDGRY